VARGTRSEPIQASLWPEDLGCSVETVTWSYSKRDVLEKCARRYYYEYYAATAPAEPRKTEVSRLKRVQNRYERAGAILHFVIAAYLRAARRGEVWTSERLLRWAATIFAEDRSYSMGDPDGDAPPTKTFPPALLREFHYREPGAEAKFREVESRLTLALGAFLSGPVFVPFRVAGMRDDALVEARLSLNMLPCRVTGQIDLAYPGEQFTVVDWKMGAGDASGDDSLQLAVYALWAMLVQNSV
jgi:PD-(D/E)XK nuclease superfamily protein